MLTIYVEIEGMRRKFETLAKTARDLDPALRIFNHYYRGRVAQRFASGGPGWPPRKDSTEAAHHREAQVKALAHHQLKRKLARELRRAQRRLGRSKGTTASVERRYLVLKEFERQIAGGALGLQLGADRRLERSVRGLRERMDRAEAKASSRLLGRIPSSITSSIRKGVLEVFSRIDWSGAHNEGATVGHGARLPARPFLFWENADIDVLVEILINRMLLVLT